MKTKIPAILKNSVFANMLMLLFLIGGLFATFSMRKEGFPEIKLDIIAISVPYPGAGPEEVEEGIAQKLEEVLQGIKGMKRVLVNASEGLCTAMVECVNTADAREVKEEVSDAIDTITTFPEDAEKPKISIVEFPDMVIRVNIWGDINEQSLKELGQDIKDDLTRIPNVSKVSLQGIREYEVSIECSEIALQKHGLSFAEVSRAIQQGSMNLPAGSIRENREEFRIRALDQSKRGDDFEAIPIRSLPDGQILRVGNVAVVHDGFSESGSLGRFNGSRSVSLIVEKGPTGDHIKISGGVRELVEEWRKKLPEGIQITLWSDMSLMVKDRIELLLWNGGFGLLGVFIVLWLFMDLKLGFWVGMGIPISLAGGLLVISMVGQSINMINLFGMIMVLGIIVDDAIVVGESIYVQARKGYSGWEAVVRGTKEVFWPVLASVSTTIVAFLPLFFVSGIMGKFIRILPTVVVAALVVSLFECLFILPVHLRHIRNMSEDSEGKNKKKSPNWSERIRSKVDTLIEDVFKSFYRKSIPWLLQYRYASVAGMFVFVFAVIGVWVGLHIKWESFPTIDQDYILAEIEFPEGAPIERTEDGIAKLEESWKKISEKYQSRYDEDFTKALFATAGLVFDNQNRASRGDHRGQIIIELLPAEKRNIYFKDLINEWRKNVPAIPGVLRITIDGLEHGPGGKDIEYWIISSRNEDRISADRALRKGLSEIKGVTQIATTEKPGKKELRLKLKKHASAYGLSLSDVAQQVRSGFFGNEALRIQRNRDEIKVKIRYLKEERSDFQTLKHMRIRTPRGDEIPLSSLVDIEMSPGYTTIERYLSKRKTTITAMIDQRTADSKVVLAKVDQEIIPEILKSHPGVQILQEGQAKESRDSMGSMLRNLFLALIAIYLIIATIFRSYIQPFIVMLVIPFGFVGAILGHILTGQTVSMFSLFGMVALTGVVVNDAIIMMEAINSRLEKGMDLFHALCEAGLRRFRPILLTTITTSVGLFPIILEKSMQAQILIPMAVSIVFGVIFATLITLVLIPCLFMVFNDLRRATRWYLTGHYPEAERVEPRHASQI